MERTEKRFASADVCVRKKDMSFNYDLWIERHSECDEKVCRLCEFEQSDESVKCNSAFCVMNHAMQDIQGYFKSSTDENGDFRPTISAEDYVQEKIQKYITL